MPEETQAAVIAAISALDRAAKVGAIHPNAAARRKSRLVRKVNAAVGGAALVSTAKSARQTGKAAAAKAAKARIAAGRATKAKGEQTAAGKARAALSRSTRESTAAAAAAVAVEERRQAARPSRPPSRPGRAKATQDDHQGDGVAQHDHEGGRQAGGEDHERQVEGLTALIPPIQFEARVAKPGPFDSLGVNAQVVAAASTTGGRRTERNPAATSAPPRVTITRPAPATSCSRTT